MGGLPANVVFSGYVEGKRTGVAFGRDRQLADVRVLQVWRGPLEAGQLVSVTAEDPVSFVSDGYVPAEKSGILVYASGEPPYITSRVLPHLSINSGVSSRGEMMRYLVVLIAALTIMACSAARSQVRRRRSDAIC